MLTDKYIRMCVRNWPVHYIKNTKKIVKFYNIESIAGVSNSNPTRCHIWREKVFAGRNVEKYVIFSTQFDNNLTFSVLKWSKFFMFERLSRATLAPLASHKRPVGCVFDIPGLLKKNIIFFNLFPFNFICLAAMCVIVTLSRAIYQISFHPSLE